MSIGGKVNGYSLYKDTCSKYTHLHHLYVFIITFYSFTIIIIVIIHFIIKLHKCIQLIIFLFQCFLKFDQLFKVFSPPLTSYFHFFQRYLLVEVLTHLCRYVTAEISGCAVLVTDNRCCVCTISLTVVLNTCDMYVKQFKRQVEIFVDLYL